MNTDLNSRYTLRNAVPLAMLLLVLLIFALSYAESVLNGRAAARARARGDVVLDAEHLARLAQREFKERPGNVASDLSVASTEPRTAALALINPVGRVEMAHRLAWRGQPAETLIAHFSPERFLRVVQGRLPDVQEYSDPPRVAVMVPYLSEGRSGAIRTEDRGVVYLEYDLGHEYALVQWDAQQRIAPLVAATLVMLLGLALLIRAKVARPLAQAERASLQLAQHTAFPPPLDESGPREIARLAHGFNAMVERLRQAQRDSDNSRARLQAIFSAAMDAIITVDQAQRITVINGAALSMFACGEADVLGHSIELLIPERFRANHADHVQRYAQKGLTSRSMGHFLVVRARRLTGEEFPAEASISYIQVDGEVLLTVILRDVTDRQKAQDAILDLNSTLEEQVEQRTARLREATQVLEQQQRVLQDAHAELRTIFNTVTVGIALVRQHVILRCNRRLEEVFGYAAGELEHQTTRLWYPDDATYQSEGVPLFAELGPGQVDQIEQEMVRKDGSRFWARITCSRLEDASLGQALLAVIEDLSLAHSAELAILDAKEQAVEASAAKSHFLANMSHEIRTPMNAIIGLSYLLQKSELNPVQREQVRKVQSSSQHLMSIINDILDYSKVEAGKLKIEAIEFDLAAVLDNVSSLIAEKAASKGLSLLFQVDPAVPQRLVGDPLRLGQIIVNFANNAVKFTEQGEVCIALGLREESAHEVLLHGAVTDSGIGIAEDQLPQLFQSFSQADSSTTRRFGGTGLGLAICKQLAALMHGEVGVDSVAGQGSTFWFTARLQKSQALPRPLAQRSGLYGQQVLVVDDSESARGVLRDMLADLNLVVHAVDSGAAALEALQREDARGEPIALVFLDWQMPQMNGIEVARSIPGLGLSQTPALVLVTGHGRAEVLRSAQQVGIETVLVKPVGASLLLDCVLRELGPKAQTLPARAAVVADATQALQGLAGARILLVEDNQLNREVAGELLSHAGLRVDMAFDGQQSLQRLAAQHYDLVLMDMQMPVMDGLSATRALRAMPEHADLPVVAMTANALPGDRQRCLEAGMNDHIAKPIEPDILFATLLKWLHLPAGQAPVADAPLADAPVTAATQAVPGELPVIAGLDTAAGLRRVRGNTAFYLSLLRKFARNHGSLMDTLQSDLQQGNLEAARRDAHTLKGLSASIGMDAISAQAALLEQQIKLGRDGNALLQTLQAMLTPFVQQLVQQLPAAVPVAAALADSAELGRVCSRLGALLADDNLEAVEWLARHETLLVQALDHSYAPIADAVRRFDCAQALSLLRIAAQSTGIALSNTTEAS